MVDKRHKAMRDEKKRDRDYERKMQAMDGPWGKPGPGGTTWRNPRDVGLNFSKSMGWTDNEIFDKLQGDHRRYKRSSLTLPQVKRVDDAKEDSSDKENVKPSNVEKLPEIKQATSPKESNQEVCRKVSAENKEPQKSENKNKTKKPPKKSKFVKRLSNGERVQRIVPEDDSSEDINNNKCDNGASVNGNGLEKKLTPEATILRVTGGIELVPLLARRRRIGARTLPSTDVTRPSDEHCQYVLYLAMVYKNVLKKNLTPEATILRVTGGIELVPLLARRRRIGARTMPSTDVTRPSDEHCQYVPIVTI
ncbi:hypothetical protein NE865_01469 [Phthorimaea operculella]|nr:hypothetical protein NE865_01469 [Phthorimaea operculella]